MAFKHTMRLGYYGNPRAVERSFQDRYGYEIPEWMVEQAERVTHQDELVEPITDRFGFYESPIDPLPPVSDVGRAEEVFETELHHMTPVAEKLVTELLGADVAIPEMLYCKKYRTDLAICEIDPDALARRLTLTDGDDRSLVDEWKFFKGYRFFRNAEPMTYEEFADKGPYSGRSDNKRVWNRLDDMGLLLKKGEYATAVNVPIHVTTHAVELKQKDWETAYMQARRAALPRRESDYYAVDRYPQRFGYADHVWVVLDAGHVDKALANREKFENGGVGLIGLDEGGAVKLIDSRGFSPPKRSLDREHVNEKSLQHIDVGEYVDVGSLSRQSSLFEAASQ